MDGFDPVIRSRSSVLILGLVAVALCSLGCRTPGPYQPGSISQYHVAPELMAITETQLERGRPHKALDTVGWVIGIPSKILLWDRRVDNHRITLETERAIADYLAVNELQGVKVRLNQYAPRDEWRRLVANKSVGAGWRYTFGTLGWVGYTIFPGRVFGGDNYNPYTNTINLYSDVPAFAIHEGGHAKDFATRDLPGTYAAAYMLPIVPLYHEAIASRDALAYAHEYWPIEDERQAYRNLGPAYGSYVGSALAGGGNNPLGFPVELAGIIGGHIVGRSMAEQLPDREHVYEMPSEFDSQESPTDPNQIGSNENWFR